jgi:regulator of protease activity HflC (stomatin/prohibitin superfamily)
MYEGQSIFKHPVVQLTSGVIALVFIIILAVNSFTRVEAGMGGVEYSLFGGVSEGDPLPEGGHTHAPWVNITQYPVSTETIALRNPKKGEDREDNSLQVNTSGGKTVAADVRYAYKFEGDRLPEIFKRFRRQDAEWVAENYIKQIILDTIQAQTTKHSVLAVYADQREEITASVKKTLVKTLAEDGIIVEKFTITDIRLDSKTQKILQQVTDAENQRVVLQRAQENLKEEAKNIEQQKLNDKIAAEGDKAVAIVNAQKKAEEIKIDAAARAEANKKLEQSLTPEIVQYEWIKKWNGAQPVVSGGSNSIVNLPPELVKPVAKK